jgi:transcriptional regulator with XRE-family HTH domain
MTGKEIRRKRVAAGLSLSQVAKPLGRTRAWLSAVELGQIPLSEKTAARLLEAIRRMEFVIEGAVIPYAMADLRLPDAKNRKNRR